MSGSGGWEMRARLALEELVRATQTYDESDRAQLERGATALCFERWQRVHRARAVAQTLIEEPAIVTDEMVERARSALDDALDHTLPNADGEDYRIVRAALEAALSPKGGGL